MVQQFDELNNIRSLPFEQYFGEMDLSDSQKKRRIDIAELLDIEILYILSLIDIQQLYMSINWEDVALLFENAYRVALEGEELDEELEAYIKDMSKSLADSTKNDIGNNYTLSYDRSRYIAENEANTVINHLEESEALYSGYSYKKWVTMADEKVRHSHRRVNNQTIPITSFFEVGDSIMRYPKDTSLGASPTEYINCRCTIKYTNKAN